MTVTIDQYGYMVCSHESHTGVCDCVRTVMMSPESSHMIQSSGLIQIPVPPIRAQVHFKQMLEGKWYTGHDLPGVPVQMWLEWMPDGSSRHYDAYLGTYLPGDTMRDVYMQIKMFLFDRYAPEADYESFSFDLKCPSKVHDQAAETYLHSPLPEHEKVSNLLSLLTENKCVRCLEFDVKTKIDMDKYVPDINGGPQARSQSRGRGSEPTRPGFPGNARAGSRNFSPRYSSPGNSPLSPSMSGATIHTTESSSIQGHNIQFGILDEASNFSAATEALGGSFSGSMTFDHADPKTMSTLFGYSAAGVVSPSAVIRGISPA